MSNKLNKHKSSFRFEELDVWQKSVDFADKVIEVVEKLDTSRKHYRIIEQLESSSTSISMNIAEGKGRYSNKEFIHFLYIARGSLFETITLLKIFYKRNWIGNTVLSQIKDSGAEVGRMINGLIKSLQHRAKN